MIDKWTVEPIADPFGLEHKGLLRNGVPLYCPFFARGDKCCGSWCPHFFVNGEEYGRGKVVLVCSGRQVYYNLEQDQEDK